MPDKTPIPQYSSNKQFPEDIVTMTTLPADLARNNGTPISIQDQDAIERVYEECMQKRKRNLEALRNALRRDSAQNPSIKNATSQDNPNAWGNNSGSDGSVNATPSLTTAETPSSAETISPPPATQDKYYAARLQCMKDEAFESHLDAWFARLGLCHGFWTQYSPQSTTLACRTLRDLLEDGDAETGLKPVQFNYYQRADFFEKLEVINFSFDSYTAAVDFLSFMGIGENRFGSGVVQIVAHRRVFTFKDGRCQDETHQRSMLGYHSLHRENIPPTPCGCVQELLLWGRFAGAGWDAVDAHIRNLAAKYSQAMKIDVARALATRESVFREWELSNWPDCPEGRWNNLPWSQKPWDQNTKTISRIFDGKTFKFQWLKRKAAGEDVGTVTVAVEGPFAELL